MPNKRRKRSSAGFSSQEAELERYFLNPSAVSRHLYCSICQDVFFEPQRAPCGHSFCKKGSFCHFIAPYVHVEGAVINEGKMSPQNNKCILMWLKQSRTCPEDRTPVEKHHLHRDFILENIIGDQMVACPHRNNGCEFVGQLQLLKSHTRRCDFNPTNLPEFLKENAKPLSPVTASQDPCASDVSEGKLPTPAKPSLKMRLFRAGGGQKQLLCSMFDKNQPSSTSSPTNSS